eukprot:TRINITY_DN410_c0_g1_i5.p1 TRINITY_DN410_c0_g1~~TRINITY_DN410_c0_g1_i5.p1  ORF type:complete len:240 (+),score=64.87 TRINITY_DN410_c0_g1_i5:120-839(+)
MPGFNVLERHFEERTNLVKPRAHPHVRQYQQPATRDLISHCDDQDDRDSLCSAASRNTRYGGQRNMNSGDILAFRDNHMYDISNHTVKVGRKQAAPEQKSPSRSSEFGVTNCGMSEISGTDRFAHTQRDRNCGDFVGHRDDEMYPEPPLHVGRKPIAPAEQEEEAEKDEDAALKVGRARLPESSQPVAAEHQPWATVDTPAGEIKRKPTHKNHYDHHEGLLTGGAMPRSKTRDRTPLWY